MSSRKPVTTDLEKPKKIARTRKPVLERTETVVVPDEKTPQGTGRLQESVQNVVPTGVEANTTKPEPDGETVKESWPQPKNGTEQPRPHYEQAPKLKLRQGKTSQSPTESVKVDGATFDLVASTERLDPHPLLPHKRDTVFKDAARAQGHADLVDTVNEQERGALAAGQEDEPVQDASFARLVSPQHGGAVTLAEKAKLAAKVKV